MDQPTPRRFRDSLKLMEAGQNSTKDKQQDKSTLLRIGSNESMAAFKLRVQQQATQKIGKISQEMKTVRPKRKEYLKRIKNKSVAEPCELEASLKSRSIVAFGEVASAPPAITRVPKQRAKATSITPEMEIQRNRAIALYRNLKNK